MWQSRRHMGLHLQYKLPLTKQPRWIVRYEQWQGDMTSFNPWKFSISQNAIQTEYVTYWKVKAFANDVECLFHFQFTPFMCSQSLLQNHTNYECSLRSKVKYILHKDVSRWRTWKHKGKRKNLVNETVEYCHQWHKNFVWDTLQLLWHWFLNKFWLQEVLQANTQKYTTFI